MMGSLASGLRQVASSSHQDGSALCPENVKIASGWCQGASGWHQGGNGYLKPVRIPFGCTLSYTSPISAIPAVFGYKFRGIPNLYDL